MRKDYTLGLDRVLTSSTRDTSIPPGFVRDDRKSTVNRTVYDFSGTTVVFDRSQRHCDVHAADAQAANRVATRLYSAGFRNGEQLRREAAAREVIRYAGKGDVMVHLMALADRELGPNQH